MASLTLVGAKLVLFGGVFCSSDTTCTELDDVYHYDLLRNDLVQLDKSDPVPPARYGHSATLAGSKVSKRCPQRCWVVVSRASSFSFRLFVDPTAIAHPFPFPPPYTSQVIVFGGASWPILLNDIFTYDVYSNHWTNPAGSPPYARKQHTLTALSIGGKTKLVVYGGKNGGGHMSNHFHMFDLESGQWSHPQAQGLQPQPTAHHATVVHNASTLVIFGGYDGAVSRSDVLMATWVDGEPASDAVLCG